MTQIYDPVSKAVEHSSADGRSAEDFLKSLDDEVSVFEKTEKDRLDIPEENIEQWRDLNPTEFTAAQRAHTTILHAGLTMAHDLFIQSAFRGLGYKVEAMDVPDSGALQFGREFGNRGQCNPTYFTVGNLIKKLKAMEESGHDKKDIIANYLFATAGSCGPCRFGTYVTEYRKALRDSGFEGFRVILFQQSGGMKQATGDEFGLKFDTTFFLSMSKAILLGDVINALMYRIRPYELEPGTTDKVIAEAKQRLATAFETRKGFLKALWQTRKEIAEIKVDRTQVKPRVAIIGEFWAMTTEGDGNYKMQGFLEKEGAEVDVQLVINWILYLLWGSIHDVRERASLKGVDKSVHGGTAELSGSRGSKFGLEKVNVAKKLFMLRSADFILRRMFYLYARVLGLKDYHLPDMDHIAEISHEFYDNSLRGGEGHMEVGKLIHNVVDQKVNMTLSIKPFGCMPSSGVSDGVQSLITEIYPTAIFLPIETNGDGAVNVYSRVQMQLFKAKQSAEKEVKALLEESSWTMGDFLKKSKVSTGGINKASYRSPHAGGCTSFDFLQDLVNRDRSFFDRAISCIKSLVLPSGHPARSVTMQAVKRAAVKSKEGQNSAHSEEMIVKIVEP